MELSNKSKSISASITLSIDAKAKKMKTEGLDVIGFGAGEPDFSTPEFIINAAKEAMDKGMTKYTPASGLLELRQIICEKLRKDNGLEYKPSQIVVSNGAKHSLYNIFQAIINPGDEVIIPCPYWVTYPELVKMADGLPIFVETAEENDFKITAEALKKVVSSNTKALVLNSPSNPSGCVYTRDELEEIAQIALENRFFIISDEIYEELIYDGNKHVSIASIGPEIKELTLLVNGVSKAFAMTGWRIGYSAGREDIMNIIGNIQSHSTSNPNSIAQYASIAALSGSRQFITDMVKEFSQRREYMVEKINKIPFLSCKLPLGAFYIMMNIRQTFGRTHKDRKIADSMTFADILLDAQRVAVVPGVSFGANEYVRLSYATSMENIRKGLDRIEHFIKEMV